MCVCAEREREGHGNVPTCVSNLVQLAPTAPFPTAFLFTFSQLQRVDRPRTLKVCFVFFSFSFSFIFKNKTHEEIFCFLTDVSGTDSTKSSKRILLVYLIHLEGHFFYLDRKFKF